VIVGLNNQNTFTPADISINVNDTVSWQWQGTRNHNVVSGTNCTPTDPLNSGAATVNITYNYTFTTAGVYPYYCLPHCTIGMVGTVTVGGSTTTSAPTTTTSAALLLVPSVLGFVVGLFVLAF